MTTAPHHLSLAKIPENEQKPFVHLHLHSEFSIQNGMLTIEQAVNCAKANNMPALAITDINNGFAWIKFYQACKKASIKPILGSDVLMVDEETGSEQYWTFLIQNKQGYLNLCELLSLVWQHGQGYLNLNQLNQSNTIGLIVIVNMRSYLWQTLLNQPENQTIQTQLTILKNLFDARYYVGLEYIQAEDLICINQSLKLASDFQVPLVATHPIHFLQTKDFYAHEAKVCIASSDTLNNTQRTSAFNENYYFRSSQAMQTLFAKAPKCLENTLTIAEQCNLDLELNQAKLPPFPTPNGESLEDFLRILSHAGLQTRLAQLFPDSNEFNRQETIYKERLDFEINTIINMGFAGYFLIVADFINWAKNNYIPVGPGRGSGAGSLVAYSLNITDLDPLAYGLLFERFLNPERVSMPDFDIDFCQAGRDKVIQYVKQKYGEQAVSQIVTFGTMAAKAAIRDVGRVMSLGYHVVDGIAKLIPFRPGKHVTIALALEEEESLRQKQQDDEDIAQLLELAQSLEGLTRNVGMHAGGVLIAPNKITDFCPTYSQDGQSVVSQFDKDDVESIGLVKFDFLGLTTLTILQKTKQFISRYQQVDFNEQSLQLKDAKTFQLLQAGNTVAVFQLESRGMQGMLKDAKPDTFEDIIALVSLYRPGPMDLIPTYIARKHGKEKVIYPDDRTEIILKETYGIMVYQEQVMQMAQIIGGYSLGGADLLRRAMGKKKPEEMAMHRNIFAEGAAKNGLNRQKADEIYDLMEKFAGYGFNKSHAAAYALIAYHTAWYKTHYTVCFMAANLTLAMDDTDKIQQLIQDSKVQKIKIIPPNINLSQHDFTPDIANNAIIYGLAALKGIGSHVANCIEQAKQEKPFKDFYDFIERCYTVCNKRVLESLIQAGCFDVFAPRWQLMQHYAILLEWVVQQQQAKAQQQASLFDESETPPPSMSHVDAWTTVDKLIKEKSAIGFYLTDHLFNAYQPMISQLPIQLNGKLAQLKDGVVTIAAMVNGMRTQMSHRGKMLILTLEDGTSKLEAVVYSDILNQYKEIILDDACLIFKGQLKFDNFAQAQRLTIQQVSTLNDAKLHGIKQIKLQINDANPLTWQSIMALHQRYKTKQFYQNQMVSNPLKHKILIEYTNQALKASLTLKLEEDYVICPEYLEVLQQTQIAYELFYR